MSLYLKYRPQTIEELDLAGVRKTLGDMVAGNKLGHAYLFTGPRGAGKTSAARILARIVNCEKNADKLGEPCNECEACLSILNGSAVDVIEIDAASNRGIDDIRELKERIRLVPSILRKKVYIIDEVHMLTTEAFNALLKTLEEPPSHAVFILCTTESHKVPETISSRCVRVGFTKASQEEMKRSFARVVAGEKADIEAAALELLAAAVDGSFRDGVKILDSAINLGKKIGIQEIELVLYGASGYKSQQLSQALINKEMVKALDTYHKALEEGIDLIYLITVTMKDLRELVVTKFDKSLIPLIYKLDDAARRLATSPVPQMLVELVIVEWCGKTDNLASEKLKVKSEKSESSSKEQGVEGVEQHQAKSDVLEGQETVEVEESAEVVSNVSAPLGGIDAGEAWHKLIGSLSGENYSLAALLSKARPGVMTGNVLMIEMAHEFHREQLMQEKFRARVEKLISDAVGQQMRIDCIVNKAQVLQTKPQVDRIAEVAPEENELVDAAEEIFGA